MYKGKGKEKVRALVGGKEIKGVFFFPVGVLKVERKRSQQIFY